MGQVEPRSITSDLTETATRCVVLANSAMRVSIIPDLGGKIASIQLIPSGEELLQQPLQPYAPRIRYMRFEDSDASGWDECLPSVAECEIQTTSGIARIPDHGDFWQIPWRINSQNENELTLSADGFSLPLRFSKTLQLDGSRLSIAYTIRNLSSEAVDYVWSAHPLFTVESGDCILLPTSITEVTVEGSAQNRLGKQGTKQSWPHAKLANGDITDLSLAGKITDSTGDKLFTVSPREGWCAIERQRLKERIELRFNPEKLPYLGLWICYGGWPEQGTNRQQCVALEPCITEGDSLATAVQQRRARTLASRAEDRWSLELHVNNAG
jgi:galactose mutarotase-like enzyme